MDSGHWINVQGAIDTVIERAIGGLNATLKFTEAQAQKHAPVRAIFHRERRGKEIPRVTLPQGASVAQITTAYRRHAFKKPDQHKAWQKSRVRPRRINTPEGPRYGSANTETPVTRRKGTTITGDFRRWQAGRLVPVSYLAQQKGGKVRRRPPPEVGGQPVSPGSGLLSARGRKEVRLGRAAVARVGGDQNVRIGGALKNSIHRVEASLASARRGVVWGYVRAGGLGVDYAGYQEFGTSHHRAHPFMRPALYESRGPFAENVKRAIGPKQYWAQRRG